MMETGWGTGGPGVFDHAKKMRTANTVCREPLLTVRQKPGGHSAAPRVGGYKNLIQLVVTDGAETDRRADIPRNAQTVAEAIEAIAKAFEGALHRQCRGDMGQMRLHPAIVPKPGEGIEIGGLGGTDHGGELGGWPGERSSRDRRLC